MNIPMICYETAREKLTWPEAVAALRSGHLLPKAQVQDIFLGPAEGTLLTRGAYIPGLGYGVKSTSVFARNKQHGLPTVQGAMFVFGPEHGRLRAIIESRLVTELKTAADSVLGASLLMRPDSRKLLIVGAGTVARSLVKAYGDMFLQLERIAVWARRFEQAQALADACAAEGYPASAVRRLPDAAADADVIATATMSAEPVLKGEWVRPGTHVDLIGAYRADMREADDALIAEGALFVDSRATTIDHVGELSIPIANGIITAGAVKGDFYDLIAGNASGRQSATEITVFKNGGGAHLDLMMAAYISSKTAADRCPGR